MTVFNRLPMTLACVEALLAQEEGSERVLLHFTIVDDGSVDGTAERLNDLYGDRIEVLKRDGSLFWSKGMAAAQRAAIAREPDFLLWINNDVNLHEHAMNSLLHTSVRYQHSAIIVGAMQDVDTLATTYSGFRANKLRNSALRLMEPQSRPIRIDTFNGNLVLVPISVFKTVGSVDGAFSHAYGDLDYGFRAKRRNIQSILAPRHLGLCSRNSKAGTWEDASLRRTTRLSLLLSEKGLPIRSHLLYLRRHDPILWPAILILTYGRRFFRILIGR